jgi:hypothetical protein
MKLGKIKETKNMLKLIDLYPKKKLNNNNNNNNNNNKEIKMIKM